MIFKILGTAAGGGFPQWNCNCNNCKGVRSGKIQAKKRMQSSAAFSEDGENWVLINASPDILVQLENHLPLPENSPVRNKTVREVILTDAQMDHTAGLSMLREGCPMKLHATKEVKEDLTTSFSLLKTLSFWDGGFQWSPIIPEENQSLTLDILSEVSIFPILLMSNAPPYSPFRNKPRVGDTIGLKLISQKTGKILIYAPDLGEISEEILNEFEQADFVFTDGTFWTDDEMIANRTGEKKARDMGHLPLSGPGGTLKILKKIQKPKIYFTHINNTNPILNLDSDEYKTVKDSGLELAEDGLNIEF